MQAHPSQYQTPTQVHTTAQFYSPTVAAPIPVQQKQKTSVIDSAIYLTIAFVVLSNKNVHKFMNNFYGMWTSQPNGFLDEMESLTFKGTIVFGVLFFVITLWLLKK